MTQQHESRWSLAHRGNRVLLAALIGLVVGALGNAAGLSGGAHAVVIALVAVVTYWLLTALRR